MRDTVVAGGLVQGAGRAACRRPGSDLPGAVRRADGEALGLTGQPVAAWRSSPVKDFHAAGTTQPLDAFVGIAESIRIVYDVTALEATGLSHVTATRPDVVATTVGDVSFISAGLLSRCAQRPARPALSMVDLVDHDRAGSTRRSREPTPRSWRRPRRRRRRP